MKEYAEEQAKALGSFSEKVLSSPSFFNERWLNATYKTKDWHADIDSIIAKASDDIQTIQAVGGKNTGAMLAHYFDRLSMDDQDEEIKEEFHHAGTSVSGWSEMRKP